MPPRRPKLDASEPLALDAPEPDAPLAARMRPRTVDEFVGQPHLVGPQGALTRVVQPGHIPSMVLWGPPGSGKTTLARLLAERAGGSWRQISAVSSGPGLKQVKGERDTHHPAAHHDDIGTVGHVRLLRERPPGRRRRRSTGCHHAITRPYRRLRPPPSASVRRRPAMLTLRPSHPCPAPRIFQIARLSPAGSTTAPGRRRTAPDSPEPCSGRVSRHADQI